jgi:Tfp pilus assembly protein PilF
LRRWALARQLLIRAAKGKMPADKRELAWEVFQQAYRAQMAGELDRAAELYRTSVEIFPTAEAHTFLGWTYHFQGKVEDAISECKRAIEVDPDFGNPYNDIGAYLISLGRNDEAISWLEQAIKAPRYDPRHFAHFNLGRVYYAKGMFSRARQCFQEALRIEPRYALAQQAVENLRRMVN